MKRFYLATFLLAWLCSISLTAHTQNKLQSPKEFLGYELGERFTRHHQVMDYFKHVAQVSSNIKFTQYGETYEHRPLTLAFIASPENFAKLEDIRKNNLRLAGQENGTGSSEKIAIVWLSYNVHGNESVGTEAAMATLYDLADPNNERTRQWLKNTVVIIDPCINPDGRERYVNWYNSFGNTPYNPNPDSKGHHEPWPGGRANHYLFDLNRDWAWLTQKESLKRIKVYNEWLPHVHVDFHEQGVNSPYYFAPAAEPFHEVITDWQREFQVTIGKNHAKYFDQNGWLYFTREVFDLLYPSYGDTYPTFNGAIGMTYEQGGSGRAGLGIITNDEDTLTLKDRIAHHYTSGLSTVEISSINGDRLVEEFEQYHKSAISNPRGKYKSYVIKGNNESDKLNSLKRLLDLHKIRYGTPGATRSYKGYNYISRSNESFSTDPTDIVISAYQPKSNFVRSLFEPEAKLSDSITYDITAWAIPYSFGLNAYAVTERINTNSNTGQKDFLKSDINGKPYAYLAKWNNLKDVKWLSYLLKKGVKVRFADEAFEMDGRRFEAGSLIITRRGNEGLGKDFDQIVQESASLFERSVYGAKTGFVSKGKDFGSNSVNYLRAPKIAVLSGESVSSLSFGEIWHYFEQQIAYPVTVLDTDYFNAVDLSKYDVLIIPNGFYSRIFSKEKLLEVKSWIRHGGRLILIGSALSSFVDKEGFNLSRYADEDEKEDKEKSGEELDKKQRLEPYANRERSSISQVITGSIFKATMDNSHPLGFGYPSHYFTLKLNSAHYAYLSDGWNVSVITDPSALTSGFAGNLALNNMKESLVFGVEDMGQGAVVYLVDNPLFRAFWQNGKLLFSNAVFMVGH
ncbi:M14 family metallopeptidase [Fulvivirgaceae bacterium BMA10]|uniref:M14 family metallopeptidase n=1 Tax=Splendidivirga corallicola TaxID=3051826 RepID=A0ABT8KT96_9BACT|nr:M14 family metallopeptidase [Fulvivirgaceae bacterium BMA10]